ncbi:sugar phosphate nucleotidyltransferase [Winogradskyella psychrotolerans]|uniref:sugar phosphate nucleotidyltransferase n=1 Tax=Winogradskyella psychrotolerans TaxID=1344585 RepID=UPI001C074AE0|nr:sugar phosphate nucleotidyltransferase [Winogradskyella psychrotolerans]MBU2928979.1 NTP transferase domain-containing protein [Winogradskyella psychrotolerans]
MHNKIDVVIMAGGKGERLMPLTKNTPKPLLKIGNKPVIEHITNHLASYGISNITITVNYLSDQIIAYFEDHNTHQITFNYIKESKSLGTIGGLKLIDSLKKDYILVMNADLLTNVNFESLFKDFEATESDALITTVPYNVVIPHDVVETKNGCVTALKEKHTSLYNLNAGIYLFKKECLTYIPENLYFDATDLINILITKGKKITNYPIVDYWLDIGKPADFEKAQTDIKHIKF